MLTAAGTTAKPEKSVFDDRGGGGGGGTKPALVEGNNILDY